MTKKLGFLGRLKAKRKDRVNEKLAEAYKRGYEYSAGRLLSQGLECSDELCAQAETSSTFKEGKEAVQFDLGVLAAVRDFTRLMSKADDYDDTKKPFVKRVRRPVDESPP